MRPVSLDLVIRKGMPYAKVFYLAGLNTLTHEIMGVTTKWPAVIVVPNHGLTHSWPVWFTNAQESLGLNQRFMTRDAFFVEPVDENTLTIKDFVIPDEKLGNAILKFASMGQMNFLSKVDLSGYDYEMVVKTSRNFGAQILMKPSTANGLLAVGPTGQLGIGLPLEEVDRIEFQRAYYEIRRVENSVPTTLMFKGFVSVLNL